jgi:phosphatidylglycerol:prolipoprotein diacylglycerol transferase
VTLYGVALALGFVAGIAVARRRAARAGLDPERVLDHSLQILVSSIAGARLLFVATHAERFRPPGGAWTDAFLAGDGLSMLGGVALASVASLIWLRANGLPALRYADLLAPSVALGEAITRIGCLVEGCCAGVATALPWGVHPTQLYLALLSLGSFALLLRIAARPHRTGAVFFALLALGGLTRLAVDPVRAYETAGIAASNALLALGIASVGLAGLWPLSHGSRFSSQSTSQ